MAFTEVADDRWIWKRQTKITPEMKEILDKIESSTPGTTYEITLQEPVKSFRTIVRRYFEGRKFINIKAKDSTLSAWYIRVDKRTQMQKSKRSERTEVQLESTKQNETAASKS